MARIRNTFGDGATHSNALSSFVSMSAPAQPLSSPPDETVIVPLNPAQPFEQKPLVADILRTRYCIPGSVFLVEGIDSSIPVDDRHRTVRLILGDGDLCVQALLGSEMHGFVDDGQVYVGCYVKLDRFEVRWVNLAFGLEDVEDDGMGNLTSSRKPKKRSQEQLVYLLVWDLVAVGWNRAYLGMLEKQRLKSSSGGTEASRSTTQSTVAETGRHVAGVHPEANRAGGDSPSDSTYAPSIAKVPKDVEGAGSERKSDPTVASDAHVSEPRAPPPGYGQPNWHANLTPTAQDALPWASDDVTKPLKLTTLRLIPSLPYKQNWMVNVLAVVASLSDVEPSQFPPYHQRTARLADPSTDKQVLLTVFLDPDDFNPRVGSVVLLLGVKNHRFDGGSLKKYVSDRPKRRRRWWFEEPRELGWCDVAGLRTWWDSKQGVGGESYQSRS